MILPKYPHGKQTEQLSFQQVQEKVKANEKHLSREALAYFWLLYYSGARKSEIYEITVEDCQITENHFIININRKKGSAQVPALELPLWFPGMNGVCAQLEKAQQYRKKRKLLEKSTKGIRTTERVKARWLFPYVNRSWAGSIVKLILGSNYYPHFLRLNRITEICTDPETNLTRIKSFTGIKSTRIIEENYMGVSKKEQKSAVSFIGKQIKKEG